MNQRTTVVLFGNLRGRVRLPPNPFWSTSYSRRFVTVTGAALLATGLLQAGQPTPKTDSQPLYQADFTTNALDKVPDDMLVLDGGFAVKEEGANKFLELPGAPLETYGVLFGPTASGGLTVTARIQATGKGRRFPTFAVGLNGVGGYKLQVSPAKKLLELYKGDEVIGSAPFNWESGSWTLLRMQSLEGKNAGFTVEGKAWKQGQAEPKDWQVSHSDKAAAPPGRPSVWGMPYAGTPIRFDDLLVARAAN